MLESNKKTDIRIKLENVLYENINTSTNTIEDMNQIKNMFNKIVDSFIEENEMKAEPTEVETRRFDDLGRISIPKDIRAAMSLTGNHRDLDAHEVDIRKTIDPSTNRVGFTVFLHSEEDAPKLVESQKAVIQSSEDTQGRKFLTC